MSKPKYSIIVPVYNERGNLTPLHQEIKSVMQRLGKSYEILFVDDGSTDGSFEEMRDLRPLKILRFRKNFGQTAALDAGFKHAQGNIFITLDADLQNDPNDIPKLLEKLDEGFDVVSGWRWKRKDPLSKRFISRGANLLRKFFVDDKIHDSGCTLKAYRRECFKNVDLHGEMHRLIPAILRWQGFSVAEMKVNHRPRQHGNTKYDWKRTIKGLLDMMGVWFWRKYANRPLHLFGGLGFIIGGAGFILGISLAVLRIFGAISLVGRIWPLVAVFMILAGIQLFIAGLMADIAIKTYYNEKKTVYSIRDITDSETDEYKE